MHHVYSCAPGATFVTQCTDVTGSTYFIVIVLIALLILFFVNIGRS